jgi:polyhydroxyalkanoate synthesis repressor PhaR
MEQGNRITIKKYANRRLYDTAHSRYVNLRQIADLIKEGNTVVVVDATTGEDISKVILAQVILEGEKEHRNLLPTEFLHQIIQYGESAYEDLVKESLTAGLDAYRTSQQEMGSLFKSWLKLWTDFPNPTARQEIETLKTKIAELEARLADRGPTPPPDDAD